MSDAVISIRGTDVKNVSYNNNFTMKPGERMDIKVKTNVAVRLNTSAPTNAVVLVKFEAMDASGSISFNLETITAVQSSTYVDDFEGVIKREYLPTIMLAVNERVRSVTSIVGLNVNTPPISFGNTQKPASEDNIVSFDADRNK